MDFVFDLTIPANTAEASPTEQVIDVGVGIIHLVEIGLPPGCANKVHVAIRQGLHQVWPTNPDGSYHWDNRVYGRREHYLVKRGDAPLVLQGWSPGTTFPHVIQFSFSVLPKEIMEPWTVVMGTIGKIKRLLGMER